MRRALAVAGSAATATGLALLLTPLETPASVPVVPALGAVGVAALAVGGLVALTRTDADTGTAPAGRDADDAAVPGDAFDEELASITVSGDDADAEAVRERVREAAVDVLAAERDVPRSVARERVDAGGWPDDERAAAFLAARPPTRRERLRTVIAGEPTVARRARHAIAVVTERRAEA